MIRVGEAIVAAGYRLNWLTERMCAALMATMVVIVWFGILARYGLEIGIVWTEELSRYVMIWGALLAVPCGVYYREHIGLSLFLQALSMRGRRMLVPFLDLCGLAFFLFLFVFGVRMAAEGANQYATIFGMTMVVPFASVPTAAALTSFQIVAAMLRDVFATNLAEQS